MTPAIEDANSKLVDIDFRGEESIDTAEIGNKLAFFLSHIRVGWMQLFWQLHWQKH